MSSPSLCPESSRIAQQLRQAFEGEAWHGPSLREILAGVDHTMALAKPIAGAHSIWEIVLHLIATEQIQLRRIAGDVTAINVPESVEWPAVGEADEAGWQATLAQLRAVDEELRTRISQFPDDRLNAPIIPGSTSAYNNFHGNVQHNLYHAAQIGLLKKLLAQ